MPLLAAGSRGALTVTLVQWRAHQTAPPSPPAIYGSHYIDKFGSMADNIWR